MLPLENMEEQKTNENNTESQNVSAPAPELSTAPQQAEKAQEKKPSDFPGQEIEHPSIKETSVEKTEEAEKVKPVIIEWKKPFFLMFGLGVAAIVLMLILK